MFSDMRIRAAFLLAWDTRKPSDAMVEAVAKYFAQRSIPFVFPSTVHVLDPNSTFGDAKSSAESCVVAAGRSLAHVVRLPDAFGLERWHLGDSKQHFLGNILSKCVRSDMHVVASDFKPYTLSAYRQLIHADDIASALANAFENLGLSTAAPLLLPENRVMPLHVYSSEGDGWIRVGDIARQINRAWRVAGIGSTPHCVDDDVIGELDAIANASPLWGQRMNEGESAANHSSISVRVTLPLDLRLQDLFAAYEQHRTEHERSRVGSDGTPYISFLTGVRADDYGVGISARLQVAINHIAHYCDVYQISYEVIFIEWNPVNGTRFVDTVWFPKSMEGRVRIITVPASVAQSTGCQANMLDMWAKNVGMRRARGEYLLNFIPDSLWGENVFESIALRRIRADTVYLAYLLYTAHRLPEDVTKGGPESVLAWMVRDATDPTYTKAIRNYVQWGRNRQASGPLFRAAGDFTLSHRNAMETAIRGHWETCYVRHVDSMFAFQARRKGLRYAYMDGFIYHQYHVKMSHLYFAVPPLLKATADQTSKCAGIVAAQLETLVRNNGDWGYRNAVFTETTC